jgi:hypothetical protein
MEEWRAVSGFEMYEINNLGRLRRGHRILSGMIDKCGYHQYCLSVQNKQYFRTSHSLVAIAFIGPRPEGLVIDHIDHNKLNNCVENLRYINHQQNCLRIPYGELRNIHMRYNKYYVQISGKKYGSFDTLEEAIQRRDQILAQVLV